MIDLATIKIVMTGLQTDVIAYLAAMTPIQVAEWIGSLSGLLGSYMLAFNTKISRYGWFSFMVANVSLIIFSYMGHHHGLLLQSIGFMGSSLLGVYRAFIVPARKKRASRIECTILTDSKDEVNRGIKLVS